MATSLLESEDAAAPRTKATRSGWRAWRSPVPELALVVLVALVYGDALAFGYIWDDHWLVTLDPAGVVESSLQSLHVRPLWYLSYVVSQRLAASAVFEHLINLTLFALSAVLAYRLALGYLDRRIAAWCTAVVWTLLPWNAYPAVWIAQRNDLLIFVFGFAALLALRRGWWGVAGLGLTLAVLSKPTVAFVPLFFAWRAREQGRRRVAWGFVALFLAYLALAVRGYLLYQDVGSHVEHLPYVLRLLRFPLHWIEHYLLLAVPVPFFLGVGHALVYLGSLAGLALGSRAAARGSLAAGRDLWWLALLASVPAAATPELRICGFESLFLLLALARARRWRWPAPIALAVVVGAYGVGLGAVKTIFDTRIAPAAKAEQAPGLYPNEYYRWRRALLSRGFKEISPLFGSGRWPGGPVDGSEETRPSVSPPFEPSR